MGVVFCVGFIGTGGEGISMFSFLLYCSVFPRVKKRFEVALRVHMARANGLCCVSDESRDAFLTY